MRLGKVWQCDMNELSAVTLSWVKVIRKGRKRSEQLRKNYPPYVYKELNTGPL